MPQLLSLAECARTLTQQAHRAVLSSLDVSDGTPYGSLVDIAPADNGDIFLLLSQLAEHRRFLDANPLASVLIAPHFHDNNPLAKPRVALLGSITLCTCSDAEREAYIARHPDAEMYLSLGDFDFYRLHVERARFIAGFGRMDWLSYEQYLQAKPDILWQVATSAIEHMNNDHSDSLLHYARQLAGAGWADSAALQQLDRYGMAIEAQGNDRCETVQVPFDPPLTTESELRPRLVQMSKQA